MRFEVVPGTAPLQGELVYLERDWSIDFRPASTDEDFENRVGSAGNTSILFDTLQVEVGIERRELLFPWGMFPRTRWRRGSLTPPAFQHGAVRLADVGLRPGVAVNYAPADDWPVTHDRDSGWICFGNARPRAGAIAIEYATDAGLVIDDDAIVALWLRPAIDRTSMLADVDVD